MNSRLKRGLLAGFGGLIIGVAAWIVLTVSGPGGPQPSEPRDTSVALPQP
jgi:hypothetical protein